MTQKSKTFLMFDGRCEREEGSVMQATFTLAGQTFMCVDSAAKHDSSFTPSMSLFVDCADEAEIDDMFAKLSDGGQVFMPLNSYPFSRKFGCQVVPPSNDCARNRSTR